LGFQKAKATHGRVQRIELGMDELDADVGDHDSMMAKAKLGERRWNGKRAKPPKWPIVPYSLV
jgi:hypothetical protein